jgi:hypothetical protein
MRPMANEQHIQHIETLRTMLVKQRRGLTTIDYWPSWSGITERLLFVLAGRVADRQAFSRSLDELLACIRKARDDRRGSCDWCVAFRRLLTAEPDADDRRLLDRFHHHERRVANLIFEDATWGAILRIATAFYVNGHLDAVKIQQLYEGPA